MEPNNTTPPQTPADDPAPQVEQPSQPQMSPMTGAPKKSKLPLLIVLVVVLLAAAGAGAYFFFIKKDSAQPTKTAANVQNTNQTAQTNKTEESAKVTSSLSNDDKLYGQGTISVTHPKSWDVTNGKDQYGANQLVIKSAVGNVLRITQQIGGVGGACEPDTYSYTLVKKIPTQSSSYVFTEYTTTNPDLARSDLTIESTVRASDTHKALAEGKSSTDVCTNIGMLYPIVDGMFVRIEGADGKQAPYDTLKTDTAFIAMLESLNVKDGN